MMESIYRSAEGERLVLNQYRHLLKRWPVPNEHIRLSTCEGETFIIASGDNGSPPLLLFHGAMSSSIVWTGDVAAWSKHFRVYAVDVIGEPGLSAPSRPQPGTDAYALWIDDILNGLSLNSAAFIGVSLGGWLVLDYAIRRPARVERLVALCPAGVGRQRPGFFIKALLLMPFGAWGKQKLREMVFRQEVLDNSGEFQNFLDYLSTIQQHFRPRVVKFKEFSDRQLSSLSMPLFVIVGAKDVIFDSLETRNRLQKNARNATVSVLPETGHAIYNQSGVILDFLESGLERSPLNYAHPGNSNYQLYR